MSIVESPQSLLQAANRAGLPLTTTQSSFDESGLDFLVVHATDAAGARWIVRTPRRPEVYDSSLVEARILKLVLPRLLPVRVPDWRLHTPGVIAYPRLDGTPAVSIEGLGQASWNIIDPAKPSDLFIESFAKMLAALQAISPDEAEAAGVPVKDIPATREHFARAMTATREALSPSDALFERWQSWLNDDSIWPDHLAMTHGDLHPGHMLLDDDGKLTGVLDWTEAKLSDPALDFGMFFGCFGKEALAKLITAFERAGGTTWPKLAEHAEAHWAAFPVIGAEWALRTGNQAVLDFTRAQLQA